MFPTIAFWSGWAAAGWGYKAEDLKLGRQVAIKFMSQELSRDHAALERFRREARTMSAVNHPNICTIHGVYEHEGRHFIVMELLEGHPLRAEMTGQPLEIERVLEVASRSPMDCRRRMPSGSSIGT